MGLGPCRLYLTLNNSNNFLTIRARVKDWKMSRLNNLSKRPFLMMKQRILLLIKTLPKSKREISNR